MLAILSSSLRTELDPHTLEEVPGVQAMWDGMMKIIEKCRAQLAETAEAQTTAHKM